MNSKDDFKSRISEDIQNFKSLPKLVFAVGADGSIIWKNKKAEDFFEIEDGKEGNINTFYSDPNYEKVIKQLIEKAIDNNQEWIENKNLFLQFNGEGRSLRFFAKLYEKDSKVIGWLVLAHEIEECERFSIFSDQIPGGLFEVAKEYDSKINENRYYLLYPSVECLSILGYTKTKKKIYIDELIANSSSELIDSFKKKDSYFHNRFKLLKGDGSTIIAEVLFKPYIIKNPKREDDVEIVGGRGIIRDITRELISEELSLGFYMIENDQEKPENNKVLWSDEKFDLIHSEDLITENPESTVGKRVIDFYKVLSDYPDIANKYYKEGGCQIYNTLLFNDIKAQIIAKNLPKIGLRIGMSSDVTKSVEIWTQERREEVGSFLHTFSAQLGSFKMGTKMVARSSLVDFYNIIEKKFELKKVTDGLVSSIGGLKSYIKSSKKLQENYSLNSRIKKQIDIIDDKKKENLRVNATHIRRCMMNIQGVLKDMYARFPISRETKKGFRTVVDRVIFYSNLITLHNLYIEQDNLMIETNLMRDYFVHGDYLYDESKEVNLFDELERAIIALNEYAEQENVEIDLDKISGKNKCVKFDVFHIKISFYNIIHNAIKYSFSKQSGEPAEVKIRCSVVHIRGKSYVKVKVTNHGTPIKKDEIERIKKFGERGKKSKDRGRPGSGVGLHHTITIIEKLDGWIEIESQEMAVRNRVSTKEYPNKNSVSLYIGKIYE